MLAVQVAERPRQPCLPLFRPPFASSAAPPRRWTDAELADLEARWFALQAADRIGAEMGRSRSSAATMAGRLGLPGRYGLPLVERFQREAAEPNRAKLWPNLARRRCLASGAWFWSDRRDGARICPAVQENRRRSRGASPAA